MAKQQLSEGISKSDCLLVSVRIASAPILGCYNRLCVSHHGFVTAAWHPPNTLTGALGCMALLSVACCRHDPCAAHAGSILQQSWELYFLDCGLLTAGSSWYLHSEDAVLKKSGKDLRPPSMLVLWALESMGGVQCCHWPGSLGSGAGLQDLGRLNNTPSTAAVFGTSALHDNCSLCSAAISLSYQGLMLLECFFMCKERSYAHARSGLGSWHWLPVAAPELGVYDKSWVRSMAIHSKCDVQGSLFINFRMHNHNTSMHTSVHASCGCFPGNANLSTNLGP